MNAVEWHQGGHSVDFIVELKKSAPFYHFMFG